VRIYFKSFTNEDHLQVHRKRHDMSLNLDLLNNGTQPDGFADETPTPTRFFRISEEVGFFQDIQNVNPFDEQFSKAATSGSEQENFQFSLSTLCSSNNDSLNTPQVLGFPTPTPTPLTLVTHNPKNLEIPKKKSKLASEEVQERHIESRTTIGNDEELAKSLPAPTSPSSVTQNSPPTDKRTEQLERNRAAAVRSRERRKQWVSDLETKNMELMSILVKVQGELRQARAENLNLREELSRHSNCNVSLAEVRATETPPPPIFHPAILRNSTTSSLGVAILPKMKELPQPQQSALSLPKLMKLKSKRGRPRKGEERRATLILPPPIPVAGLPLKVQIMPLKPSLITTQSSSVIVLHTK